MNEITAGYAFQASANRQGGRDGEISSAKR